MTEPGHPLTSPDCDLRGLQFMPLDVIRLIDSDLFALSTGDEFKAAVALWCKSWLQVPAASLPNDDRVLAHLSSAGAKWKKVKSIALRGWVECSDGRLYHPVIAEKALEAMSRRQEHETNKALNNQRKQQEREDRKLMFAELRELGKVPSWDTPTSQLRELLSQARNETGHAPVTVTGHAGHEDVTDKTGTGTGTGTREKNIRTPKADAFGVLQILETFPTLGESVASDFVKHRKNKRAPLTQSAWDAISREIMASGWTPDKALRETMARGWQSFKADWVAEKPQRFGGKTTPEDISNWVPTSMRGTPDDPLYDGDYIDAIQ